jgi:hypothetical protein
MTTKLILAFTVAAVAFAGSLAAPGNAFADDGKSTAIVSNRDADHKDKRRNRGYDWQSVYHYYRGRYEPDDRRYRDHGWTTTEQRDRDHPRRRRKGDDTDAEYDWKSVYHSYRDRYDHDWTYGDRDHPRRKRKDDD